MTLTRLVPLVLLLVVAAGCDSSEPQIIVPEPVPITISGRYDGTTNFQGIAVTIESTLTEINNSVSGSGTLRITESAAITATGTHVGNDFNITFRATGIEDLNFAGTVNGDASVLRGQLNGSGFQNIQLTLIRSNPSATAAATVAPETDGATEIPEGITTFRELFEHLAVQ